MKTKPEDPMITVFAATDELVRVLSDQTGLPAIDILAGMHGELVRHLVVEAGFEEAERYLCASIRALFRITDEYHSNPSVSLLAMTPAGEA